MIPEHRLAELLDQVKQRQIANCLYHNTAASPSLFSDHLCDRKDFPSQTMLTLGDNKGEIWQLQFSHDGSKLASCGSNGTAIIYDVKTMHLLHVLRGHESGVGSLAWSPDDTMILTCGQDKKARLWNSEVRLPFLGLSCDLFTKSLAGW
jgi:WD40 repeat protein